MVSIDGDAAMSQRTDRGAPTRIAVRTTSTQRTYRYVRLSLVGVLLFLGIGVTLQIVGGGALTSVSAAFYTPARDVFVGALCAVSLALLALSGRSVEQVLLDIAAVLAPLVALVPTPLASGDVLGLETSCPDERSCIPPQYLPGIENGVVTLLIVGVIGLVGAAVLAAAQGTSGRGLLIELAVIAVLLLAVAGWWTLGRLSFLLAAHNVAAGVFFALIAAVAALAALRPAGRTPRSRRRLRLAYTIVAAGMLAAVLAVAAAAILRALGVDVDAASPVPVVLGGEALALALFAAFWVIQTIELWRGDDPAVVASRRGGTSRAPRRRP
jgi:hypothetical protein